MSTPLRVLFVEDSVEETALLVRQLRRGGYDPTFVRVDSADTMGAALGEQTWDIIIAEYTLSRFSAPAALDQLRERGLDLPFIIVSAGIGEDRAVSAFKAGAHDYVNREDLTRLVPAVERAVREAEVRRAQAQADEHLAWLASFEARNPHAVIEVTGDGKITYLNPAAVKKFPNVRSAGLAHPILKGLDALAARLQGSGQTFMERDAASDDSIYHQTLYYVPEHNIIRIYLVDVTQRKRAEEEQARLTAIIEATPDLVGTADVHGSRLYLNRAGREMIGLGEGEDVSGTTLADHRPEWVRDLLVNEAIPTAMRDGVWSGETVFLNGDGREIAVSQVILAHRAPDGAVEYLSAIAHDITERYQAEERVRKLNAELEQRVLERTAQLEAVNTALDRALAEVELLNAITTAAAGEDDLGRILSAALHRVGRVIPFTGGSVALVEGDALVIRAAVGPFAERALGLRQARGKGRSWQVVERAEPFLSNDVAADGLKSANPIRSYLAVPLIWRGRAYGIFEIDSTKANAFDAAHVPLMQKVAAALSGPIELARRYAAEVRAGAEAEAAQRRFRDLVQGLDAIVWEADAVTLQFSFVSQRAEEILGYPLERWLAEPDFWVNLLHPEDRERAVALCLNATKEGRDHDFEYRAIAADGREVWLHDIVYVVRDDQGRARELRGMMVDITERKNAERRLEAQHAVTRILAEASSLTDAAPKILQTICKGLGWQLGILYRWDPHAEGLRLVEMWHVPSIDVGKFVERNRQFKLATAKGLLSRVWTGGKPAWIPDVVNDPHFKRGQVAAMIGLHGAFAFPIHVGSTRVGVVEFFSGEIRQPDDDLLAMMEVIGSQIGQFIERKWAEEILHQAKDEAERASRAKSEFLSRMSHELRTPLNAILGFGQLLEMEALTPEQHESVELVLKAGRHLLDLINEVLDIARIESGGLALAREPVPLEDVVRESLDLIAPVATGRNIQLNGSAAKAGDRHVMADPQRLKQVLLNLLSNAVKYNREGGGVVLSCEETSQGRIRITVSDTGPGIPPEKMKRLFTPFERLGAEQTGVEGTGIGLALSKRLVEVMEGEIGVESEVGRGSTF